jgi:hypothetical protein
VRRSETTAGSLTVKCRRAAMTAPIAPSAPFGNHPSFGDVR